jgi:hypothetical protein
MVVQPIEHCAFMPRQIIHDRLWRLSGGEARVKILTSPCQAPGVMEIQRLCGCGLFTTHRRRGFSSLECICILANDLASFDAKKKQDAH